MNLPKPYLWLTLLSAIGLLSLPAKGETFLTFSSGAPINIRDGQGNDTDVAHGNLGETFTVSAPDLVITELGVDAGEYTTTVDHVSSTETDFDPSNPGTLTTNFTATLYNTSLGTVVGSVEVAAGTAVDSQDFAYAAFSAPLIVGDTYVVAGYNGTPGNLGYTPLVYGAVTAGSGITLNYPGDYGDSSTPSVAPSYFFGSGVNGNFQYESIPEPSSLAFLALGATALTFALRRKLANNI